MSKPTCRPAQWGDTSAMAEIAAKAFDDNDLCGRYMHPHRHQYWSDYVTFWRRDMREHFFDSNVHYIVSTVDDDTNTATSSSGKVVGAAKWKRQGKQAPAPNPSWITTLQRQSIHLTNLLSTKIYPNRSADPTKANCLAEAFPFFAHHWSGPRQESWFLDMLCVHPDYQGQGHGRALVEWGKAQARRDGVCASVTSAERKEGFYMKVGFVEVGRANVGPLEGVQGGAVMFCDRP